MPNEMNSDAVFVTIDSKSTKDIDDAILIAKTATGFQVLVAIADPTKEVRVESNIDERARELAATVYAGDHTKISMLPRAIAQDSGSLVAGESRKSFVFSIGLDEELQVTSFQPSMKTITVAHRLSYEDIPVITADSTHPLHRQVKESVILGQALLQGRRAKGALALYDLKNFLLTDEEGNLLQMKSREDTVGHVLVQEMMILTNTLFGQYLVKNNIPGIYRNHQATVAAPPTHELRKTIESLLLTPDSSKTMAFDKLHALLGRAKYEAVVRGHYGLNLPVYTHGTSPLRRYADLVNLRQLKSHLNEKPFVYDSEQLVAIAEHLNVVMLERKESSTAHFKSVVAKKADRLLTSGDLSKMDDTLLTMAIKNVMAGEGVHGLLAAEICKRLARNTIADTVTDRLFFEVDRAALDDTLAESMSTWLHEHPMKSMHFASHGTAVGYVAAADFETENSAGGFRSTATLKLISGEVFTGSAENSKKKLAEQFALSAAFLDARGLPKPAMASPATPVGDHHPKPAPTLAFNSKGALLELCSKHKAQAPVFTFETQGPSHKPVFRCTGRMSFKGQPLTGISPWSETKKGSEAHAANEILEKAKATLKASTPGARAGASQNPVGDLQELAMKNGILLPEYDFSQISQTPPLFECKIYLAHGVGIREVAQAASKAESKKMAASKALLATQG